MKNKTVLVVDDSLSVRLTITNILKNEGFNIIEATDGEDGLKSLKNSTSRVDFVICDYNMPVMNGPSFIKSVRDIPNYRFVKILMLTGSPTDSNKEIAKKSGATAWMVKPFTTKAIVDVVNKFAC